MSVRVRRFHWTWASQGDGRGGRAMLKRVAYEIVIVLAPGVRWRHYRVTYHPQQRWTLGRAA